MTGLFFIYGLAFFSLGLTIFTYPKADSKLPFARHLGYIASFGILHGLHEWLGMFSLLQEPRWSEALQGLGLGVLALSYLCLIGYGSAAFFAKDDHPHRSVLLPLALLSLWVTATANSADRFVMGDIWARYLLAIPGALLTACSLARHGARLRAVRSPQMAVYLILAAVTLVIYGFLAGVVVPKAALPPASLLNETSFLEMVGLPVQLFRTLCAVTLTYSLVRALSIFRWETRETLRQNLTELEQRVEERTLGLQITNERLHQEILFHRRTQMQLRDAMQRAEEEKAKAEAIIAAIGDGISIQNKEYQILFQNQTHQDLLGMHLGETCYQAYGESDEVCRECPVRACLSDGGVHRTERVVQTSAGERFVEITASPLRNAEGDVVACVQVVRDITQRKRVEEEQLKTEKLESLGVLAGGIAHDFNNLLTGVLANINLSKLYSEEKTPLHERLVEAEKASSRARDLVRQLLTFAKGGIFVKKTLSLGAVLRESATLAVRGSRVRLDLDVSEATWQVEADEGQLAQLFQNLVINATQAMPKGGTITVCTENRQVDQEDNLPLPPGAYIKVTIRDQGPGIAERNLGKIFDPYFTTKEDGSGLGLSTAYSIAQKHNGHIAVETGSGGTSFYVHLPSLQEAGKVREETTRAGLPTGKGKILFMDDETYVRRVAGDILTQLGYSVVFAQDGAEAVVRYAESLAQGRPFDAVIVDLTIPGGMGGEETLRRLRELDPKVRGIVASGYSNNPILASYRAFGFQAALAKPFDVQELGETVQKVLLMAS